MITAQQREGEILDCPRRRTRSGLNAPSDIAEAIRSPALGLNVEKQLHKERKFSEMCAPKAMMSGMRHEKVSVLEIPTLAL